MRIEVNVVRGMQSSELLGLDPVSLVIKKNRLWWFGHVEYWVQHFMAMVWW